MGADDLVACVARSSETMRILCFLKWIQHHKVLIVTLGFFQCSIKHRGRHDIQRQDPSWYQAIGCKRDVKGNAGHNTVVLHICHTAKDWYDDAWKAQNRIYTTGYRTLGRLSNCPHGFKSWSWFVGLIDLCDFLGWYTGKNYDLFIGCRRAGFLDRYRIHFLRKLCFWCDDVKQPFGHPSERKQEHKGHHRWVDSEVKYTNTPEQQATVQFEIQPPEEQCTCPKLHSKENIRADEHHSNHKVDGRETK